jgi:hypothetical protein
MDVFPNVDDVDVEVAGTIVPNRIFASRGFAHPRMWAQYADNGLASASSSTGRNSNEPSLRR